MGWHRHADSLFRQIHGDGFAGSGLLFFERVLLRELVFLEVILLHSLVVVDVELFHDAGLFDEDKLFWD